MKTPGKVTPAVRRRVFALKAEGKSLRETEAALALEGVSLTYRAVGDVLKGPAPEPEGAGTASGTGGGSAGVRDREGTRGVPGEVAAPITEPPEDASAYTRDLHAQLKDAQRRMREIPADDEKSYAAAYASMLRAYVALLKEYHASLPKPPVDPSKDPHSIAARAMIEHRVTSTVDAVLERARKAGFRFPGDP